MSAIISSIVYSTFVAFLALVSLNFIYLNPQLLCVPMRNRGLLLSSPLVCFRDLVCCQLAPKQVFQSCSSARLWRTSPRSSKRNSGCLYRKLEVCLGCLDSIGEGGCDTSTGQRCPKLTIICFTFKTNFFAAHLFHDFLDLNTDGE